MSSASGGSSRQPTAVFTKFRAEFIGKCSPVHFFWGSFDLAVTRFSGRRAPERPDADTITREAYSHEVSSVGFWPGDSRFAKPAFYSYAAPEPAGFRDQQASAADAAYYNDSALRLLSRLRRHARAARSRSKRCSISAVRPTTPRPTSASGTALCSSGEADHA